MIEKLPLNPDGTCTVERAKINEIIEVVNDLIWVDMTLEQRQNYTVNKK